MFESLKPSKVNDNFILNLSKISFLKFSVVEFIKLKKCEYEKEITQIEKEKKKLFNNYEEITQFFEEKKKLFIFYYLFFFIYFLLFIF
jgi:hypothetical protein